MKYRTVMILSTFFLAVCLLAGCSTDSSQDKLFDEVVQQIPQTTQPSHESSPSTDEQLDAETPAVESSLSGTLSILTNPYQGHLVTLAKLFMKAHPGVRITFIELENYGMDISQQTALITKLLTDPPDIFEDATFVLEKINAEALFIDLKEYIDGPDGIDRSDYFDSVLRGAEVDGKLYHVPMMVDVETVMLNKQYFEAIGVPISDIRVITLAQFLDYQQRAAKLFPGDDIGLDSRFHMMDIFRFEQVYDLSTGRVSANTPEIKALFELIKSIRVGSDVEYTPEEAIGWIIGLGGAVPDSFTSPSYKYMYHSHEALMAPFVFFIQEHPDMRFSHPVIRVASTGEIRYRSATSPAIMRDSPNKELAWKFIRFCMEYTENLYNPDDLTNEYNSFVNFPVNRALFDNQVHAVLDESYYKMTRKRMCPTTGDEETDAKVRKEQVDFALFRFKELMEMVNCEERYNEVVMNSLVYPDVYLYVMGRQDVDKTLINIQSRLELYIAE